MSTRTERSTAEERREEVLRAAIREFAEFGLHGASTEKIAARVGISQPYIFRLYGTKKGLFLAALETCYARLDRAFADSAAEARAAGTDRLHAMGEAFGRLLGDRDELLVMMHGFAAAHDAEVRATAQARFGSLYRQIAEASGASEEELRGFFSFGMLLMVAAALDLPDLCASEDWARDLLGEAAHKLDRR